MKYVKAEVVFPEDLLREIQKYVKGELVYIPNPEGTRKKWGQNSGGREYLNYRNSVMREKFSLGVTINQLSDEFYLSIDSVKKIVYCKK